MALASGSAEAPCWRDLGPLERLEPGKKRLYLKSCFGTYTMTDMAHTPGRSHSIAGDTALWKMNSGNEERYC